MLIFQIWYDELKRAETPKVSQPLSQRIRKLVRECEDTPEHPLGLTQQSLAFEQNELDASYNAATNF